MANEIALNASLSALKGSISRQRSLSKTIDWTLARDSGGVQNIPTTAAGTALVFGAGVTTLGIAYFVNLDPTNYIEVGLQTGGTTFLPFYRLKPGEFGFGRLTPSVSYFAKANASAADLEFGVLND